MGLVQMVSGLSALGLVSVCFGSERVTVAAASDLIFCMESLNAEFAQQAPGITVQFTTGSSGNFHAQIRRGAPYDVFMSADLRYPRALIDAGAAEEASLTLYAVGRIVLWCRQPGLAPGDLAAVVRNPGVRRFAIANPDHAPYGLAARQALERSGAWTEAGPKLVLGENISQAAQFIQTGNADAGIVALSLMLALPLASQGNWVEISEALHDPLEQAAVLTKRGAANPAARRYLTFLRSPEAREIFERFGFRLPVQP